MTRLLPILVGVLLLTLISCDNPVAVQQQEHERGQAPSYGVAKQGKPGGETAGNNLSFPVIWSEGVTKTLPGTSGMAPILQGTWWYWWGTEADDTPLSCAPDPDDMAFCDNNISNSTGPAPPDVPGLVRAYLQKDPNNLWQAESADWSASPVAVDSIDWGDNLESVDWYTRSQVRTEIVLFQDLDVPMLEYEMRHVSGWGIDEVHGLAAGRGNGEAITGPGTKATVYSSCARLTIQKLLVAREDVPEGALDWIPEEGWTEIGAEGDTLVNPPIFNEAAYLSQDGPGYYSAEINVKGRIIYGYTWNVRQLNDAVVNGGTAAGDYRITFSFDQTCGLVSLNTFFVEGVTGIITPSEEEEILAALAEEEGSDTGGATGVLVFEDNLTYMDVRILARGGGNGGGNNK